MLVLGLRCAGVLLLKLLTQAVAPTRQVRKEAAEGGGRWVKAETATQRPGTLFKGLIKFAGA